MWTWLILAAVADPTPELARDSYVAAVARMVALVGAADTAAWTFRKQEWADGAQQPRQVMAIKYRRQGDIYLKYVGDHNAGREVLYRPGVLPGEILVNPSPMLPTMTFDLDGRVATEGERYTVDNLSLHRTVDRFKHDDALLRARDHRGMVVEDLGRRQVGGEAARCWRVQLPKNEVPSLYAQVVETCVADRTQVMVSIKAWDDEGGQRVLIEDYVWVDLRLGLPLTDADFDPEHQAYGF
jgi:hypothetical protein